MTPCVESRAPVYCEMLILSGSSKFTISVER